MKGFKASSIRTDGDRPLFLRSKRNDLAGIFKSQITWRRFPVPLPYTSQAAFPSTGSHDSTDVSAGDVTVTAAILISKELELLPLIYTFSISVVTYVNLLPPCY